MTDHPITPPPELVQQWTQYNGEEDLERFWVHIATRAAQWGADQELEACCEWIPKATPWDAEQLRAARRPAPKPPSLKEQSLKHLEVMERDGHYLPEILQDLRRALEQLDD
jgi:hypothetical protein